MLLVDFIEPVELPGYLIRFRRQIVPAAEQDNASEFYEVCARSHGSLTFL